MNKLLSFVHWDSFLCCWDSLAHIPIHLSTYLRAIKTHTHIHCLPLMIVTFFVIILIRQAHLTLACDNIAIHDSCEFPTINSIMNWNNSVKMLHHSEKRDKHNERNEKHSPKLIPSYLSHFSNLIRKLKRERERVKSEDTSE